MKVTDIRYSDDNVIASFDDGHVMTFVPYSHGFGYAVEGLRGFRLDKDGESVCIYRARLYRAGPQPGEHCIGFLADGYTQQQVAAYWDTARDEAKRLFRPAGWDSDEHDDRYWYAWIVTHEGFIDLGQLREGKAKMVEEVTE
jgi:hypothetical protein